MYLISSTKMRKAKREWDQTRPYFEALRAEVKRIFRTSQNVESRYLFPPEGEPPIRGTYGCLVITADKGLAGAYNQNVIREAQRLMEGHPDMKLFVVGEYGRQFFMRRNVPIERSFLYTAQNPTMQRAREISAELLERFDSGELKKIFVDLHRHPQQPDRDGHTPRARCRSTARRSLRATDEKKREETTFEFLPSLTQVLDSIVPSYVSGFIYSALIDSFCSEQNARMSAMYTANQNAEKMLDRAGAGVQPISARRRSRRRSPRSSAGARAQRRAQSREEV